MRSYKNLEEFIFQSKYFLINGARQKFEKLFRVLY